MRPDTELAEQPAEQRIVPLVVDEEARVEREPVVDDRVRVATRAAVAFEHMDFVGRGKKIGGTKARDAASDHRDPHQPVFASRRISVDNFPSPV